MTRRIRVRDLNSGQAYASLFCRCCCQTFSADKSDYFLLAPDTVLTCCDEPMSLVRRESRLVEVRP